MSIKDRLKTAYENLALNGDETWSVSSNTKYKDANKQLHSRELLLNDLRITGGRPRSVKDSIPNSKLSTYADFEYNEPRELSYNKNKRKTRQFEFLSNIPLKEEISDEPWLLPDVDSLFMWFIYCQNRTRSDYGPFELCNEQGFKMNTPDVDEEIKMDSPLLDTIGFQERSLKIKVFSDSVKSIWNIQKDDSKKRRWAFSNDLDINELPKYEFFEQTDQYLDEAANDFDRLKELLESFEEQKTNFEEQKVIEEDYKQTEDQPVESITKEEPTAIASKRLYSAVLQGLSTTSDLTADKPSSPTKNSRVAEAETISSAGSIVSTPTTRSKTSISATTLLSTPKSITKEDVMESSTPISDKITLKEEVKMQKKKKNKVKSVPKTSKTPNENNNNNNNNNSLSDSSEVPPSVETSSDVVDPPQNYDDSNVRYANNPGNSYQYVQQYQVNAASHYSNTYHNSNCVNYHSASQMVTGSRSVHMTYHQRPFVPYQYVPPMVMLQQNRTHAFYPIAHPVPPPYYYQPMPHQPQHGRLMQRWILPQTYPRTHFSHYTYASAPPYVTVPQSPPTIWVQQQQQPYHVKPKPKKPNNNQPPQISILKNKPKKPEEEASCSAVCTEIVDDDNADVMRNDQCASSNGDGAATAAPSQLLVVEKQPQTKLKNELEEVVKKTVNLLLDDEDNQSHVPVSSTVSEELEIQALEQYCNSNDSVYRELERQAEEQYDDLSENWKSPPMQQRDVFFGGLRCFNAYSIDVKL